MDVSVQCRHEGFHRCDGFVRPDDPQELCLCWCHWADDVDEKKVQVMVESHRRIVAMTS